MSTKIGVSILILLVILGGFLYSKKSAVAPDVSPLPVTLGTGEVEFVDSAGKVSTTSIGLTNPASVAGPVPSLTRPLTIPKSYDVDAKRILQEKNATIIAMLKASPTDSTAWINLGVIRKIAEDYEGAKEAWEYSKRLNPKASVAHSNLADLYMSYLKDYPKSEAEWKAVIALDSTNTLAYRGLFELYHLYYKAKADQAPGALLLGLKANPKDVDLMIPLAQYYKEKKDTANARLYFQKALDIARERKDTQLIKLLEDELKNL